MNVFIIAEDPTHDKYILLPLIRGMMKELGRAKAKVLVCENPHLRGVDDVLKWERIEEILRSNAPFVDLFLVCVDRDGNETRSSRLRHLETRAAEFAGRQILLAENAWQEIEVWVLAGHSLPREWSWRAVREEVNPKEVYFFPFARQRGLT